MQILANGLVQGLLIALLALGFTSVYLPTRVLFLALAGVYSLAPYLVWQVLALGGAWPLAVVSAATIGIAVSSACEWFNHRPLQRQSASSAAHFVSSLGLFIVIVQLTALIWGSEPKVLRAGIDTTSPFGGILLTRSQLLEAGAATALLTVYFTILRYTKLGIQFRALADNPVQLALHGHNTDRLRLIGFAAAGFLGTAAGLLQAYDFGFDPHTGLNAVLLAIAAVVVGGRHSFLAPIIGGLLVGILRAEIAWFFSARWQDAATFALLALVLMIRPNGLLGTRARMEAAE